MEAFQLRELQKCYYIMATSESWHLLRTIPPLVHFLLQKSSVYLPNEKRSLRFK